MGSSVSIVSTAKRVATVSSLSSAKDRVLMLNMSGFNGTGTPSARFRPKNGYRPHTRQKYSTPRPQQSSDGPSTGSDKKASGGRWLTSLLLPWPRDGLKCSPGARTY